MKNQKGITLIALIVSIIIMLILVAVTITLVTQGGLIDKTIEAKNETRKAASEETNMQNEVPPEIDLAVDGYYLNPNPQSILTDGNPDERKEIYAQFGNYAMLVASSAGAVTADDVAIPVILAINDATAENQTIYTYFYNDYTDVEIESHLGVDVSLKTGNISQGWYKVTVVAGDTITVTGFEEVENILSPKIIFSGGILEGSTGLSNMDNFAKKTPYTN